MKTEFKRHDDQFVSIHFYSYRSNLTGVLSNIQSMKISAPLHRHSLHQVIVHSCSNTVCSTQDTFGNLHIHLVIDYVLHNPPQQVFVQASFNNVVSMSPNPDSNSISETTFRRGNERNERVYQATSIFGQCVYKHELNRPHSHPRQVTFSFIMQHHHETKYLESPV